MNSIDLSQCEQEQIQIPGFIQPHGFAISYNSQTKLITGFSANLEYSQEIIGKHYTKLFAQELLNNIAEYELDKTILYKAFYNIKAFVDDALTHAQYYDVVWSRCGCEMMIELVVSQIEKENEQCKHILADNFSRILPCETVESISRQAAEEIKEITGFDRVMVYQFDKEYNGCVIAETKKESMNPYLGLNFPASDIPPQARELYRKQTVRAIVDIDYVAVNFVHDSSYESLDMTYSYLRSVSPVHVEYLQNMGVKATLTISIVIDGKLWGLIGCHHSSPLQLNLRQVEFCRAFGSIFEGILKIRLDSSLQSQNIHLHSTLEAIVRGIQIDNVNGANLTKVLSRHTEQFTHLFNADSFALIINDDIITKNATCPINDVGALIAAVLPKIKNGYFYTSNLKSIEGKLSDETLKECSGVLAISVLNPKPTYWIWMRREKIKTLTWGGNPNAKVILEDSGKISPRKSFESFKETVKYTSELWEEHNLKFIPDFIKIIEGLFRWSSIQEEAQTKENMIQKMEDEKIVHYRELLESLVNIIEKRDAYTAGHTLRVANYCNLIADELGIEKTQKDELYEAAILHDIGKVIVPDTILLKPGTLSKSEYRLIKDHLIAGYEILNSISYYKPLAEIMRYHHEKFDGSGYPYGFKGEEIPLRAHIMIVADAIDAMTSNRIYQARKTMAEAIAEIVRYKGIWYDPVVVDATVKALKNIHGDSTDTQIPLTPMERARFSYYFKDHLTGAYNEDYLKMIIENLIPDLYYEKFIMVELNGMTKFNHKHGWHEGDLYIQKKCNALYDVLPKESIFRIFGDDFIIACKSSKQVKKYLLKIDKLNLSKINVIVLKTKEIKAIFNR